MIYLRYILCFPLSIVINLICWWTNPIVCLFPKRLDNGRDELISILNLWSTYDNYVDEYFYGKYPNITDTLAEYENSRFIRYKYRLKWLNRNTGYGWSQLLLSIPTGTGFQWKGQTKPFFGFYNDYNVGYKSHKGFARDDYAARIIGLRKIKA